MTRRLSRLLLGLCLFGASIALLVKADLGLDPWDVLHQGLARRLDLPLGVVVIGASVVVLCLWVPLRQRPGVGTVANTALVGVALGFALRVLPTATNPLGQSAYLLVGILANAVATGLYIGAGLGPGPRDGLMTGLAARGLSIRVARTGIEVLVLVGGWSLGGTVGVGTVAYALAIGPLTHIFLPLLRVPSQPSTHARTRNERHEAERHHRQHSPWAGRTNGRRLVRQPDPDRPVRRDRGGRSRRARVADAR